MEIIFILLILFIYVFLDSRESKKKRRDKNKKELDTIFDEKSQFDKYLENLKPEPKQPKPKYQEPDLYTGSNEWYEFKRNYLQSDKWQALRQKRFKKDNYCCFSCKQSLPLELHHITYKRLGNEHLNDVRSLCRDCHQAIHDKYGYDPTHTFPA